MVFGVGFMSLLSVFVSWVLAGAADFIPDQQTGHYLLVNMLFPFSIVFLLFAAIFKFLPDVTIRWKHVWPGALIGAILFTAGKYALQIYLEHSAAYSIY